MMQDPYFVASNLFQAVGFYNFISEFFWGPNFNWTGCNLCAKPVFAFLVSFNPPSAHLIDA